MTITIQISNYNWRTMEEDVYETEISSIEDLIKLSYGFDKRVQYKKPTDKNWYYCKTMIKRLFKKELSEEKFDIRYVSSNNLDIIMGERYLIQIKTDLRRERLTKEEYEREKRKTEEYLRNQKVKKEITAENIVF